MTKNVPEELIYTTDDAFHKICPFGVRDSHGGRCVNEDCMGWTSLTEKTGYCTRLLVNVRKNPR